jgi:hypothetical protein
MPIKKLTLVATFLALAATTAFAQTPSTRVRGTVEKLEAGVATVKTTDGQSVTLKLAPNLAISAVVKLSASDIKPGSFIGAGARPMADGSLGAIQINVFPEAQRGTGEGHRDWSAMPQTTMTNATVAETVSAVNGPVLTLKYKDGEKKLVIGPDAIILTTVPAEAADLKVGAELVTTATKNEDGTFSTARVTVGKNGVAPPL